MSKVSRGILGVIAISLAFGAVAWGRDLAGTRKPAGTPDATINRAAKADRATAAGAGSALQTRTISLRLDSLSDTTVVIRLPAAKMPAAKEASDKEASDQARSIPSLIKPSYRKAAVACEPPVSVLTEVAKRLEPGRCVT
jgi:hypothetical protein